MITARHFTVQELAEAWRLHEDTVRKMFQDRPGVLKVGLRARMTLRIPEDVAEKVYRERCA